MSLRVGVMIAIAFGGAGVAALAGVYFARIAPDALDPGPQIAVVTPDDAEPNDAEPDDAAADRVETPAAGPAAPPASAPPPADAPADAPAGPGLDRLAAVEPTAGSDPASGRAKPAADPAKRPNSAKSPDSAADLDPAPPRFDIVRVDRAGQTVIAGRATPNQSVEILLDGEVVDTVSADATGKFVAIVTADLAAGPRELRLRSTLPAAPEPVRGEGDARMAAAAPPAGTGVTGGTPVEPDMAAPSGEDPPAAMPGAPPATPPRRLLSDPVMILPADDAEEAPALVESRQDELAMLQHSGAAPDGVVIDQLTRMPDGGVALRGRARPGHFVRVYGNAQPIETAPVTEGGWSLTIPPERADDLALLRFDEIARSGQVTSRVEVPFDLTHAGDQVVRERTITVQRGDNLWRIAEQHYGQGIRYSVIFGANSDLIRDPDLIYPDQVFTIPQLVEAE